MGEFSSDTQSDTRAIHTLYTTYTRVDTHDHTYLDTHQIPVFTGSMKPSNTTTTAQRSGSYEENPMISDENTWIRLDNVLYSTTGIETAYVYRLRPDNTPIRPYVRKYFASHDLVVTIQRELGAGHYGLMIRKSRRLIFSGGIYIGSPPRNA